MANIMPPVPAALKAQHAGAYRSWQGMRARCRDLSNKHYGGKGITVCPRWRDSFLDFLADMGDRPPGPYSINRLDSSKNYEPGNCEWALPAKQARHKVNNFRVERNGESFIATDLAALVGLNVSTFIKRIRKGQPVEEALLPSKTGKAIMRNWDIRPEYETKPKCGCGWQIGTLEELFEGDLEAEPVTQNKRVAATIPYAGRKGPSISAIDRQLLKFGPEQPTLDDIVTDPSILGEYHGA